MRPRPRAAGNGLLPAQATSFGVLNTALLGSCFSKQQEIRRWQAHQTAPDALRILLVVSQGWNEQVREAALATMRHNLGQAIRYELVVVDDIPLAPNGKFQTIVPLTKEPAG